MKSISEEKIAVVGAGSIGVAWSVVFATNGYEVTLYDPDQERLNCATREFEVICGELAERGLVSIKTDKAMGLLRTCTNLKRTVENATYVQECAPEKLALKKNLFAEMAEHTSGETILASSTSTIPVSLIVDDQPFSDRALLVHPLNPPYLLRVVEIVPSSSTSSSVVARSENLMKKTGMEPLTINEEIEGFLFNRLQGALLREAYCLVRDGVASADQIDKAISSGLGIRWSVLGVFETVDLNTRGGIEAHAAKLGPAYLRMGAERGQKDEWTKELVAKVAAVRRKLLPLEKWEDRIHWRNQRLMDLAELRNNPDWH